MLDFQLETPFKPEKAKTKTKKKTKKKAQGDVFGEIRNLLSGKQTAGNGKKIIKLYEKASEQEQEILKDYILDHTEDWNPKHFKGSYKVWHKRPGYCLIRDLDVSSVTDLSFFTKEDMPERLHRIHFLPCATGFLLIEDFEFLPKTVKLVNFGNCDLKRAGLDTPLEIPEGIERFSLFSTNAISIHNRSSVLKELSLHDSTLLRRVTGIPEGLEELGLWGCSNVELPELPLGLKSLNVMKCFRINDLSSIPDSVEQLSVSGNMVKKIRIPDSLKSLYWGFDPNTESGRFLTQQLEEQGKPRNLRKVYGGFNFGRIDERIWKPELHWIAKRP